MTEQEMVDHFARLARPRLSELLRLKVEHIYDPSPGDAQSTSLVENIAVRLKLTTTRQPYASIARFAADDKEMGFVVNPGLIPLVKAISFDLRGRSLLLTRKLAPRPGDRGVVAHLEGFGVRLLLSADPAGNDTLLTWETLFGVA